MTALLAYLTPRSRSPAAPAELSPAPSIPLSTGCFGTKYSLQIHFFSCSGINSQEDTISTASRGQCRRGRTSTPELFHLRAPAPLGRGTAGASKLLPTSASHRCKQLIPPE